ncbi:hypothetical protein GCM10018966_067110 [Streptomyces yanii]
MSGPGRRHPFVEDHMARTPKPVTWYMATPAYGTIELSRQAGTPVCLADRPISPSRTVAA